MLGSFFSFLMGGSIVKWLVGGVAALVVGFLGLQVWDYSSQKATIQKDTDLIAGLRASLKVEQTNRDQDATTILTLNNRLKALQEPGDDLASYCDAMKAADAAPDAAEPAGAAIGAAIKKLPAKKRK